MKVLILDMYGVILKDPEGGLLPFVQQTFPEQTYATVYHEWAKGNIGKATSADFFSAVGYTGDLERIMQEYLDTIEVDPAFYAAAEELGERFLLGLISNDLAEWSAYLRHKYDLDKYFASVQISGEVKCKKPEARIFELLMQELGVCAADCLFVDDREVNLEAAKLLGMHTILFNSRKVSYDGKVVDNFAELVALLTTM